MDRFGLEGVVVAETSLSKVDGDAGELIIAGVPVAELARSSSFAEVCARLWDAGDAVDVARRIGAGRVAAFEAVGRLGDALDREDGMIALRNAVAHVADDDFAAITGAVAVFAAAWWRRRINAPPIAPDPDADHAADYARMVSGSAPDPAVVRALSTYLVTVCDHGMNASTFAARVVTSTRSDAVSAVVAAIGALRGPLHGGAPGPVLDMLDAIARDGDAARWIDAELAAGRRIMGMGHRVYRVRDARAAVLEAAARRLGSGRIDLARAVEVAATSALERRHPDRRLRANVEFYTAALLEALGFDRAMFTPTFAVGRVAGWLGHVAEQREHGRLIRPRARYVERVPPASVRTTVSAYGARKQSRAGTH